MGSQADQANFACLVRPRTAAYRQALPKSGPSGHGPEASNTSIVFPSALVQLSADQRQAATGDAVGVFIIGVPVSSLTGADKEGMIAQKKGEVIAIETAQRGQKCGA